MLFDACCLEDSLPMFDIGVRKRVSVVVLRVCMALR